MPVFVLNSCDGRFRRGAARLGLALMSCIAGLLASCDDAAPPPSPTAPGSAAAPRALPAARAVRFVKFEEVSEWNGNAWASIAELNLLDATGATIDRTGWTASADAATDTDRPANAIDGDTQSIWHTPWQGTAVSPPPHALTIDLGMTRRVSGFRYLPRQDKTVNGTIAKFNFFVSDDGEHWNEPVASGDFATTSGPKVEKTVVFAAQTPNHPPSAEPIADRSLVLGQVVSMHILATDADGDPLTFAATGLPPGLALIPKSGLVTGTPITPGVYRVELVVSDDKGASTKVATVWTVPAQSRAAIEPLRPGEARFVKLEELSEVEGKPWGSVAEFNLVDANGANLPRTDWSASADSVDANDGAANAIDGLSGSIWHTQWDGAAPPPPHSLIVDLGHNVAIRGFRYLPRQDAVTHGMIAKFRFYESADGLTWGVPVAEGDFSQMGAPRSEKTVMLK